MKKFISGFLTCALIGSLTVSALAITGKTTIEVYPINIMVNGEVFQPTNAQGTPVDVFTYQGTTYAPLRALAEAYGLTVGYDAEKKLATVNDEGQYKNPTTTNPVPNEGDSADEEPGFLMPGDDYSGWSDEQEIAYQEFKSMWEVSVLTHLENDPTYGSGTSYMATYCGSLSLEELRQKLLSMDRGTLTQYAERLLDDQSDVDEEHEIVMFSAQWGQNGSNIGQCAFHNYKSSKLFSLTSTFLGDDDTNSLRP